VQSLVLALHVECNIRRVWVQLQMYDDSFVLCLAGTFLTMASLSLIGRPSLPCKSCCICKVYRSILPLMFFAVKSENIASLFAYCLCPKHSITLRYENANLQRRFPKFVWGASTTSWKDFYIAYCVSMDGESLPSSWFNIRKTTYAFFQKILLPSTNCFGA